MGKVISEHLSKHPNLTIAAGFALLGLVAWLDYKTGVEISFSIFYLIPVSLVAWNAGLVSGVVMSVIGAATWFVMDYALGGHVYSSPIVAYWNSLARLAFFVITAVSLARIRLMLNREEEGSRLKSDLVSMVSHEFNNSLVTINLVSTLLQEEDKAPIPEQRLKLYGILDQTSRNLKILVKNFLNKARIEAGRFVLDIHSTELRKIIIEVVDIVRPLGDAKNISLNTDFPVVVIPVKVDPDAISLVINNLIGNAIKYTPQNGRVTIRIVRMKDTNGQVLVSVEDSGIGIDKTDLGNIFSGFYRAAGGKNLAKGFGIGLKVAKELLEAHGSQLKVESTPGRGSIFSFTLPVWESKLRD